jgi:heptosyltransferase II
VKPLFPLVRDVDDTIAIEELAGKSFEAALLLPNSFRSALLAYRAGIAERWGYRTECRAPLLTRAVPALRGVHQIDFYQGLTAALGFPSGPGIPRLDVGADLRGSAATLLADRGWNGRAPLVALAPGAAYGGAKRWPPEYFAELARALRADGIVCVMVGSAGDRRTGDEVEAACGSACGLLNLIGATDLSTLAGVLVQCRSLVSNDSGAMHLGAALGVPVTAMFGPTNDRATRPLGAAHVVLTNPVWCRPCMLRECPLDHRCLRGISATAVHDAARRNL